MVPTAFNEENTILDPPVGTSGVDSISVWRGAINDSTPCVISCWKLTVEELEEIKRTGRVYLMVMGHTMPPVHLTVNSPWESE